jgi:hypothetical protein
MTNEQKLDLYAQIITAFLNRMGGHAIIDMTKDFPDKNHTLMYRINDKNQLELKIQPIGEPQ